MEKENFILHDSFNKQLSKGGFEKAKADYLKCLHDNKFAIKKADSIYDLINNIKRSPEKIGPYQGISVFEALNRIGSDLVLLSGAAKLFKEGFKGNNPKSIHLRMGTTKGFDFEVLLKNDKVIYGEAFNAAKSFCKAKMRQAIHKLMNENPDKKAKDAIVFVNEDVRPFIENYINTKEQKAEIVIHRVFCGKLEFIKKTHHENE